MTKNDDNDVGEILMLRIGRGKVKIEEITDLILDEILKKNNSKLIFLEIFMNNNITNNI